MKRTTYADSGVDLDRYDELIGQIKRVLKRFDSISGKGLFGGTIDIGGGKVIVASTDGVGTKAKVGRMVGQCNVLGRDIVAHCVNDILCMGARPVAFMDYIGFEKLDPVAARQIIAGIASECRKYGIQLIGGETAEMPGVYTEGEFDIVGFVIGLASRKLLIDGSKIKAGDLIVALPSNGLHTNGYSLARKVLLEDNRYGLDFKPSGWKRTLKEELLLQHRNYFNQVYPLIEQGLLTGIAHITGGGIAGNLRRILPRDCDAIVVKSTWTIPPIFKLIAQAGEVEDEEMFRVFNMGIGMLLVVPHKNLPKVVTSVKSAFIAGEIVRGHGSVRIQ
ncbi:MAG: phosphoribosylformylglycinamidine cyclo-ligase [bacterium]